MSGGIIFAEDFNLPGWCGRQRSLYRMGLLPKHKIRILESLPNWSWDPIKDEWEKGFMLTKKYGNVIRTFVTEDGFRLGQWQGVQVSFYNKGKLPKERIDRLNSIKAWSWNKLNDKWEEGYNYTKKYGVVPQTHVLPNGYRLGSWQAVQRWKCKDKDRRKKLEAIPNWSWNPIEEAWFRGLEYTKKYGVVSGRDYKTPEGYRLEAWQNQQRLAYNKKKLSAEKIKLLEKVPTWIWSKDEETWKLGIKYLKKYGLVKQTFVTPDGFKLGIWIGNWRARKYKLDKKRIRELESIPGWYWTGKKK